MGKSSKAKRPVLVEGTLEIETDVDELEVTLRLVNPDPEGPPFGDDDGITIRGDSRSELIDSIDSVIRDLIHARVEIEAGVSRESSIPLIRDLFRSAMSDEHQAADGEDVASNAGTISDAPGGGAT